MPFFRWLFKLPFLLSFYLYKLVCSITFQKLICWWLVQVTFISYVLKLHFQVTCLSHLLKVTVVSRNMMLPFQVVLRSYLCTSTFFFRLPLVMVMLAIIFDLGKYHLCHLSLRVPPWVPPSATPPENNPILHERDAQLQRCRLDAAGYRHGSNILLSAMLWCCFFGWALDRRQHVVLAHAGTI